MTVKWDKIRSSEFPAASKTVQLKSAGGSPLSRSAYNEAKKYYDEMLNYGDIFWKKYFTKVETVRLKVAEYLNAKPSEIGFLINTSSCMNVILNYLDRGKIIYPKAEFPVSIHAVQRRGIKLKAIKPIDNKFTVETIKRTIDNEITTLITSHIQYLTGFRQILQETGKLCKDRGIMHVVNATQSLGAFPIDVIESNIDLLVASGLKWACTGYGIGVLYIKEKLLADQEIPPSTGWLSVEDPFKMDPYNLKIQRRVKAFDASGGAPHFPQIFALGGALSLLERIGEGNLREGIRQVKKRILFLSDYLIEQLKAFNLKIISPLEKKYQSGIITIDIPEAEKITRELRKNEVFLSCRRNPDTDKNTFLRISVNFYNNTEDIDILIKSLKTLNQREMFF